MVSAAVCFGDGRMQGMLLVLLYVSHSSASCGIQKTNVMEISEEGLVNDKEFPWVVSLQDSQYTHLAFGSILSEFWIISIASVLQNRKDVIVIVGIAKMDAKVIAHEEYPVNTIIIHEDFDNKTMTNNIALLKTDTPIGFNNLIQPICFLDRNLNMPRALRNCWVAGWNPTSATGNHMTMSILRKISVKDIDLCPLHKIKKTGCGNHIQQETDAVCLGDPGNPMMCQLQQLNMWVLRGILSHGGENCPGLFLYINVEDYSDWIMSKTKKTSRPLSSFHHWEEPFPFSSYSSHIIVTPKKHSGLGHGEQSQADVQEQNKVTLYTFPTNSSTESPDLEEKGLGELGKSSAVSADPIYSDYYGEAGEGSGPISGQNRLHQPQEIILFFFVLVFFCNDI
ncbi:LOW QUALITY PROTEIN: inactive serine protease 54 [Mirounga angustirostris]|uniref:LOW QUALITY PROTEIN: inactive serine protease 54 n=1 Tax=Mirounga leonina TaxID=9715 RepID=UPI00156BECDA|nr:LOW QUALITY PROTEIN: inactive serine protease 54 [Mirounga leonina]XP_045746979.1 LOW QUALITY PROTEIN: inactive serine protease 54 [Mirounga angustirostris]